MSLSQDSAIPDKRWLEDPSHPMKNAANEMIDIDLHGDFHLKCDTKEISSEGGTQYKTRFSLVSFSRVINFLPTIGNIISEALQKISIKVNR